MNKQPSFKAPVPIKVLQEKFGARQSADSVEMRSVKDVSKFLEQKRHLEEKTAESNLIFK